MELFSKSWRKCTEPQEWILMLEFFFDDSGQESWCNEQFICIGGYLAWSDKWDGFVPQWGERLMENGITHVHMKELIHLRGQYSKWDTDKRESVLTQFVEIIKRFKLIPFGVALDVGAWRNLPSEVKKRYGKAQHFCFLNLLANIGAMLHHLKGSDFIHIVTDTDPNFAKPRFDLFSWARAHDSKIRFMARSFTFADPQLYSPLQAADLFGKRPAKYNFTGI